MVTEPNMQNLTSKVLHNSNRTRCEETVLENGEGNNGGRCGKSLSTVKRLDGVIQKKEKKEAQP